MLCKNAHRLAHSTAMLFLFFFFFLLYCENVLTGFGSSRTLQYFCFLSLHLHFSHGDCISLSLPSLTVSSLPWSMIMNITPLSPFISVTASIRGKNKDPRLCEDRWGPRHTPLQTWPRSLGLLETWVAVYVLRVFMWRFLNNYLYFGKLKAWLPQTER